MVEKSWKILNESRPDPRPQHHLSGFAGRDLSTHPSAAWVGAFWWPVRLSPVATVGVTANAGILISMTIPPACCVLMFNADGSPKRGVAKVHHHVIEARVRLIKQAVGDRLQRNASLQWPRYSLRSSSGAACSSPSWALFLRDSAKLGSSEQIVISCTTPRPTSTTAASTGVRIGFHRRISFATR